MDKIIIEGLTKIKDAKTAAVARSVAELLLFHLDQTTQRTFYINCPPEARKIALIKALREIIPGLSLKDAKDLSEGSARTVTTSVFEKIQQACQLNGAKINLPD